MTSFWLNNPTILLDKEYITEIWPTNNMDSVSKLNAITRLVILLTILGYFVSRTYKVVITGIVTLFAIILLNYVQNTNTKKSIKETFVSSQEYSKNKGNYNKPTIDNPLMNVKQSEIADNPKRKQAAPSYVKEVQKEINDNTKKMIISNFDNNPDIEKKLFKDLGDSLEFEQSMRNWYSTPNTQIPNDQEAFTKFCYPGMTSCKEGDALACTKNMPPRTILD